MSQLIIFTPFRYHFEEDGGSPIRIAGYTKSFNELGIDYKFLSPVKPDYVPDKRHIYFKAPRWMPKALLLHNVFCASWYTKILSYFIRIFILRNRSIIDLLKIIDQNDIIIQSHQDVSLALFLKFRYNIPLIFNPHGILHIQKEYLQNSGLKKKIWFYIALKHEKCAFKYSDYIDIATLKVRDFIKDLFKTESEFLLAPDGFRNIIPLPINIEKQFFYKKMFNINKEDFVIFFAGDFKKHGGVHQLVDAFITLSSSIHSLKLILKGRGQMEHYILDKTEKHKLADKMFVTDDVPPEDFKTLQSLANIIVIPDAKNTFNTLVPHIKLFDSLDTGIPVLASDFKVRREFFPAELFPIYFYKPSDINDLTEQLRKIVTNKVLIKKEIFYDAIYNRSYFVRAKAYVKQLSEKQIL